MDKNETHTALVAALREALTDDTDDGSMLIRRIPAICNDIRDIKSDLRWMKWIGAGFVTTAGLLALKSLGL